MREMRLHIMSRTSKRWFDLRSKVNSFSVNSKCRKTKKQKGYERGDITIALPWLFRTTKRVKCVQFRQAYFLKHAMGKFSFSNMHCWQHVLSLVCTSYKQANEVFVGRLAGNSGWAKVLCFFSVHARARLLHLSLLLTFLSSKTRTHNTRTHTAHTRYLAGHWAAAWRGS